ncbi:flagellar export chaperone FliS [Alkalicoccobacillus porphyridii]|uniref:Flagellar secretion chaperone FliS n=1 Tax=Alkalicoccobacillus porphyridii TaxID=2597270 RepID=A0A554A3Q5_9BACI|nr:flagellar export chaperone FliS [Alkalicoccobacillus porphyridii]TSB48334.1 flagellar export chaperone FliS [Alkalicoccobacillus porphyridii]
MTVSTMQSAYKQNALNTASPGELTLMLYNGCLKFIHQAEAAIQNEDVEKRNVYLTKAQNIIRELMVTLKLDTDLAKDMSRMYEFILSKLIDANIKNDQQALKDAEGLVVEFRDTWKQAIQLDRQNRHGSGGKA